MRQYHVLLSTYGIVTTEFKRLWDCKRHWLAIREGFDLEIEAIFRDRQEQLMERPGRRRKGNQPAMTIRTRRAESKIFAMEYTQLIMDEAHCIKNPDTLQALAMKHIEAGGRGALTGTPMQNSLMDLQALLACFSLAPFDLRWLFKSCYTAKRKGTTPKATENFRDNNRLLSALRASIVIRRIRGQNFEGAQITDLPPMDQKTFDMEMEADEAELQEVTRPMWDPYEKRRAERKKQDPTYMPPVGSESGPFVDIIHARINCIHPRLLEAKYTEQGVEDLVLEEDVDILADLLEREKLPTRTGNVRELRKTKLSGKALAARDNRRNQWRNQMKLGDEWESDRLYHVVFQCI